MLCVQVAESLDSLIDELSYLRDQANSYEPISYNPPDIQEQIADTQVRVSYTLVSVITCQVIRWNQTFCRRRIDAYAV
jgi:hypothetical protein